MSRLPDGNPAIATLQSSVFTKLAPRLREHRGPIYPLHIGDTYLEPPAGCHLADQTEKIEPGIHQYASPRGRQTLIEAIVERRNGRPGEAVSPEEVLITTGVTGALTAIVRALLSPGQEIILVAPYWPLIRGISVSHGVRFVEVPLYDRIETAEGARQALEEVVTPNTAAIYVNWPNNPSGRIPSVPVVDTIVEFAERHDLWIISDEVYEELVFEGPAPTLTMYPEARDRVIRTFSFSKAYGMAGNRVGYLIAPKGAVDRIVQLTTYLVYSVSTGGQRSAEMALKHGDPWLIDARGRYEKAGRAAALRLGLGVPQGGTFLFVDVSEHLDERGTLGFLEGVIDDGLVLAPGEIFGAAYANFVRLCFTCVPPEEVATGVEILAKHLGR